MPNLEKTHARFEHVFMVARLDLPIHVNAPEKSVTGTKVYYDEVEAEREAERLNALNGGKDCKYIVLLGRLVPKVQGDSRR